MSLNFQSNVSLAKFTTYKIGGPAKFFCMVESEKELFEALNWAKKEKMSYFILGGGSNILFSDNGFDGLVMKFQISSFKFQENYVNLSAGCLLSRVVIESTESNLSGLEWAAGIPGTVGGAVIGNAGAYGGCMADLVEEVIFFKNREVKIFSKSECEFYYRESVFKKMPEAIVLSVKLKFAEYADLLERIEAKKRIKEIIETRKNKIPREPSAGSVFKNINFIDLKPEIQNSIPESVVNGGKIAAAWFIEQCGLKGENRGGAKISEKHTNFIINTGGAKAVDVLELIKLCKERVFKKFGIELEEEIRIISLK